MTAIFAACVGVILLAVSIRVMENRFIYFPPRYPEGFPPPEKLDARVQEIWLTTRDGVSLNAFNLPNDSSPKALLWFHGNAENIGYGIHRLLSYARLGVSVLALDYRGYGKSSGSPDEAGVYLDADAAYDYLVRERHVQPENLVVLGQSLGGAVAVDLASRRKCGGLIVVSSFTTARDMARRMFRLPLMEYLPKSRFDSLAKIARVRAPILVVHGRRDEVVPFSMGQRLFAAAPEPKWFYAVEGAGHNDVVEVGGERYFKQVRAVIEAGTLKSVP
jgi:fermentation-respiration switch protein FrsA (DUF1100 family)